MSNQYTLPGVMQYLQSEWTANETFKLQWANERDRLNSLINRLMSENEVLKIENQDLRNQLKRSNDSNGHVDTNIREKFDEIDINPLIEAKKHLNNRLSEVLTILDNSTHNEINLFKEQDLLRKPVPTQVKSKIPSINASSIVPKFTTASTSITNSSSSLLDNTTKLDDSEILLNEGYSINENDTNGFEVDLGNETDNETIYENQSQDEELEELVDQKNDKFLFDLRSQIPNNSKLDVLDDLLLSGSKDGVIKSWTINDLKQFHYVGITPLTDIKWINSNWFLVQSGNRIYFYIKDEPDYKKFFQDLDYIKDIAVNDKFLVLSDKVGSLHVYEIVLNGLNLSWKESKPLQPLPKTDSFELISETILLTVKNSQFTKIDLKNLTHQKHKLNNIKLKASIDQFKQIDDVRIFITNDEIVVYDYKSNLELSRVLSKNVGLKNDVFVEYTSPKR